MKSPFLRSIQDTMRKKYYSKRTEDTYITWIKAFIRFHELKHPKDMGAPDVVAFLDHLALHRNVAPRTQGVALNSLVFMYRHVLDTDLGDFGHFHRAKSP